MKNPNRVGHWIRVRKERGPYQWSRIHEIRIAFTIGSALVNNYSGHWSFDIGFAFTKFNIGAVFPKFESRLPLDLRL